MVREFIYDLSGRELKVTIGKVAEQANGSCLVQCGETVVLVNACASKEPREGVDFFPLSCDFEEKLYSVGKIPGGFIKREGRPSEKSILTSRLIDRPLRPLFPEGYRNDVQVIATALSVEQDNQPDILAMIGSSIALTISDIPFNGPTGSVNVGYVDGEYVINPTIAQREKSRLNITVSGTKDAIMMVEAGADILSEEEVLNAILFAHEEIKSICNFIETIREEVGKEKSEVIIKQRDEDLFNSIIEFGKEQIISALRTPNKMEREENLDKITKEIFEKFLPDYEDKKGEINSAIESVIVDEVRRLIIEEGIRPDDRELDEVRKISCERGLLPRTHGSGLFTRGQTQVLTLTTLGAPGEVQVLDGVIDEDDKRYMHQYNFPPFSVGDVRPLRSPGRREIGHGALAERALVPVLPSEEEFPYTMRLVSEVLSSNGSSSQASICGSTLSLLDAGVPIKDSVAGIAMGLIKDEKTNKIAILTDIQGLEDHFGDMDFKVAGTKNGITALQMDIKIDGISREILATALEKAKRARLHILSIMNDCIATPSEEMSKYAPKIFTMQILPEKIREVIGPGGKVINKIIDETGVKIDTFDDGRIAITADSRENGERAKEMINEIVKEIEVGEIYSGVITTITNFGAFVELIKGKEGLLHISNMTHERLNKVEDLFKVGDVVEVKVIEIDNQGKIKLSRKALLEKPKKDKEKEEK
ncbi:polyribonucleotide nucleotidyltransferase [Parvimonas sp. D2]|uniref:polyribonucleotide nucleotidyltransferase n=1 Tax=unclassified Parvimonas TaxID=1151464 RepID=UPI00020DCBFF|nr:MULTISPECIES: polyribonucleotide nucleotidyltransferase [unclassified Parvimonas]EGL38543.1 polyribonucleotide nucleotidyltransferase [Parvimonas sp. oral taxon 110 str. F0139]MBF1295088.1 polyribonucleotide nucleotidyltransferase [Parvimonas sp.]MBF1300254.1 polyribonucleotide nucleotidyltransferase [Parvimonas sp.]MEB3011566.1 polyribonucleotide nucleotidyltransferase [Parvimonas sp. D2]MEB3087058.1 polyribonucleotide nucleotidyltransferase [Parvimonas sp. D4]